MGIRGIGIDLVDIARFKKFRFYDAGVLKKIFHETEIAYCCANAEKSAERFAVRFAAKEAFFKALSQAFNHKLSLLSVCRACHVVISEQAPKLAVDWVVVFKNIPSAHDEHMTKDRGMVTLLSLSHATTCATAVVFLEKI